MDVWKVSKCFIRKKAHNVLAKKLLKERNGQNKSTGLGSLVFNEQEVDRGQLLGISELVEVYPGLPQTCKMEGLAATFNS